MQNNRSRTLPVYFYAFDLLNRDGESLLSLPIERRRDLLGSMLSAPEDPLRASLPCCEPLQEKFLRQCASSVWKVSSGNESVPPTNPGERSGAWIKLRANLEQEFVIGGYIPGARGFDALLVGVYQNKQLIFSAKVKNGFVPRIRDELFPALKTLQTAKCPFTNLPEERALRWGESLTAEKMSECRWVKPRLVCQIAFVEWTDAGHLRHCTFIAMRDDKSGAELVRET